MSLTIVETKAGREQDNYGIVSFIAMFKQHGKLQQHAEVSEFKKGQLGWMYVKHKD